jgi:hypothetical protein
VEPSGEVAVTKKIDPHKLFIVRLPLGFPAFKITELEKS